MRAEEFAAPPKWRGLYRRRCCGASTGHLGPFRLASPYGASVCVKLRNAKITNSAVDAARPTLANQPVFRFANTQSNGQTTAIYRAIDCSSDALRNIKA